MHVSGKQTPQFRSYLLCTFFFSIPVDYMSKHIKSFFFISLLPALAYAGDIFLETVPIIADIAFRNLEMLGYFFDGQKISHEKTGLLRAIGERRKPLLKQRLSSFQQSMRADSKQIKGSILVGRIKGITTAHGPVVCPLVFDISSRAHVMGACVVKTDQYLSPSGIRRGQPGLEFLSAVRAFKSFFFRSHKYSCICSLLRQYTKSPATILAAAQLSM
jgi:hypothetical protein